MYVGEKCHCEKAVQVKKQLHSNMYTNQVWPLIYSYKCEGLKKNLEMGVGQMGHGQDRGVAMMGV